MMHNNWLSLVQLRLVSREVPCTLLSRSLPTPCAPQFSFCCSLASLFVHSFVRALFNVVRRLAGVSCGPPTVRFRVPG